MALNFLAGLRPLRRNRLFDDFLAGVNLASINIPQVLGYTRIAGTPVVTGLYTVLLPLIGFAIFGSSRHLVVAADSATAAIFSSSLSRMAIPASEQYMELVGCVALLTAGLLLVARIFRIGFLADFLSRTVLIGFLAGVGVQVSIAMLHDMAGVAVSSRHSLLEAWSILRGLANPHWATLALSLCVAVPVLAANRLAPRFPLSGLIVVGSIAASAAFDFSAYGIAVIGPVPGGLPSLRLPHVSWNELLDLLPVAASCFVIIIAQSAATAQGFAAHYGEEVDEDADIMGLAAANAAAAVSGAFVVNGSPTQTAVADRLGARSQFSQLTLAAVVVVVLVGLTGPLQYLPRCVLAAIVFTVALGMVDVGYLRDIQRQSPGEFYLSIATAATVIAIGVTQGILLAIALSLFMHVRHSYRPHTMMLVPDSSGRWVAVPAVPGKQTSPGLIVYRFGADLFYANKNLFASEVLGLVDQAPTPVSAVVIDASAITDVDFSAAQSLCALLREMSRRGIDVSFGRVNAFLRADLDRHGITDTLGAEHIFATLHAALAAVNRNVASSSSGEKVDDLQ